MSEEAMEACLQYVQLCQKLSKAGNVGRLLDGTLSKLQSSTECVSRSVMFCAKIRYVMSIP